MKRLIGAFLCACMIFALAGTAAASAVLTTTGLSDGSLTLSIDGNGLTVSGAIRCEKLESVRLAVGEEERFIPVKNGGKIEETFPLSGDETRSVTVYTKKSSEELYWSYLWQTVFVEKAESGYRFVTTSVADHNAAMMEVWLNPADWLGGEADPVVKAQSDAIVSGKTDDYDKILAIHEWTAKNIYYDNDYAAGKTGSTPIAPAEVLSERYSVCQGYANLVQALCQAQGIPAIVISTYGAGVGTDGFISEEDSVYATEPNHAHAAAWVDGRWIHMDTTWDSMNRYEDGQKTENPTSGILYFDPTLEFLSLNHKILEMPVTVPEKTPSAWAAPEVRQAFAADIVPYGLQGNYTASITRAQFCELLMTMLTRRLGYADVSALLADRGLTIDGAVFTDIAAENSRTEILAANALGIVNGRGDGIFDPASGINRQEAAAMLMRAASVLGVEMGENPRSFADIGQADQWAVIGVLYTSSLIDKNGKAVMGGVDEDNFSPKTAYTVEQSILTMIRMFTVE